MERNQRAKHGNKWCGLKKVIFFKLKSHIINAQFDTLLEEERDYLRSQLLKYSNYSNNHLSLCVYLRLSSDAQFKVPLWQFQNYC